MMKIGLVGEDPNDTDSLKNLLLQKHNGEFSFIELLRNKRGHQLDNARTEAALKIEFEKKSPHYIVFIRDADGLPGHDEKIDKVNKWFQKLNHCVDKKGILLINIYELEAMILADIQAFNKIYRVKINFKANPMYKNEPKEFLIKKTFKLNKQYSESHCPDIFKQLNFDIIFEKCEFFKTFYIEFLSRLGITK